MSAVLEAIVDLAEPEAAAQSIHALNDRLAAERTIPPEIADAVRAIVAGLVKVVTGAPDGRYRTSTW